MAQLIKKIMIAATLLMSGVVSAQVADNFFKVTHVAGNVHMLEAPDTDGNIGVFSGPDGVLLIDDRYDRDTENLLVAVRSISDADIRFLVNTHVHPDHIGGNNNLAAYGVTILAHDDVRVRMLTELRIPRRGGITFPQPPPGALPVITYSDAISFHLNGEEVRVFIAPPAHTDGDSFVHFLGSDVMHLGDVFRTNMYPIIDVYNGGSFLGMIAAMELAIELAGPDTKVIPGHGSGVSNRAGMQEVLALLYDIRERVAALVAQGLTLEQTMVAAPTAHLDERWGKVPSWTASDLIPIVYEELRALNN
ncbi:MAG: MBL fold metallo-hydrolase [Pseudohongiella sp.]|nr:MBL fold metallo-hydrolase [Pseudohongiella sp.]